MSFNFLSKNLGSGNTLYIIDIETIDEPLKICLDNWFVKVCEGNRGIELSTVKTRVANFLGTKAGSTTEMGAVAEFLLHVFLNEQGYQPQFLYTNLEENSIKKGFDGYYLFASQEWILESKSGSIGTAGISHAKKVKESYDDLKSKLAGEGPNNPWENAYKHASQLDVNANPNVRKNIDALSQRYTKGVFQQIKETNIIPGATIFLNGTWKPTDSAELEKEVLQIIEKLEFKKMVVVCVTKSTLKLFLDYLKA
ncbi:hypothetical protein [Chryseosolibacter indicus]|uniref:Anti-bacteriophage protein A/HamA C-terminal domain-containing protein n=1 Tax=Chryseosolibacter indicus TaxID=2782351 RepID=A0ABS5VWS8_9BACT|nr:hypothetical protein [Chryseosolibacter indicus]MBT1705290.1 hypothetical protein [Chryseosolibacter indicus]